MRRSEKEAIATQIAEKLRQCQGIVLTDYRGLNVRDITELRKSLREAGAEFRVVKNSVLLRAAQAAQFPDVSGHLTGPNAVLFLSEDPVGPAKALVTFIKEHQLPAIKGGWLEGREMAVQQVEELAAIPAWEQLIGILAASLESPISQLVMTLETMIAELVMTVQAIATSKA